MRPDGARDDRSAGPPLSVLIVTFNSGPALRRSLPSLVAQLEPSDELVIVDNASADDTREVIAELAPRAVLIESRVNSGFAAACNAAANAASADLLVLLNPDAVPLPGFCSAIRRPLVENRGWTAWMGLVTTGGGRLVNSSGGVIHFTGLAWAGGAGRDVAEVVSPREVSFVSGACLAVPRETWRSQSGFSADFFMYCEDVDLSLRLRLDGGRLGVEPAARVDHDYEFTKGELKWRMLERNRWATVIRTYPGALVALLAPAMLATELTMIPIAFSGGWGRQKLLATTDTLGALPRLLRERRSIQDARRITAREFAAWLTPDLDSPYLAPVGRLIPLKTVLRLYWSVVRALLTASGSRSRRSGSAAAKEAAGSS